MNNLICLGAASAIGLVGMLSARADTTDWQPLTNNVRMAMAHTSWLGEQGVAVEYFRVQNHEADITVTLQPGDEVQVLRERLLTAKFQALYSRCPFRLVGDPTITTYWRYTAVEPGQVTFRIRTRAKTAFFYVVRRRNDTRIS